MSDKKELPAPTIKVKMIVDELVYQGNLVKKSDTPIMDVSPTTAKTMITHGLVAKIK